MPGYMPVTIVKSEISLPGPELKLVLSIAAYGPTGAKILEVSDIAGCQAEVGEIFKQLEEALDDIARGLFAAVVIDN